MEDVLKMAITLKVEDYCPEFEADIRTERLFIDDSCPMENNHIISCSHCDRCREIHKSIERTMKK